MSTSEYFQIRNGLIYTYQKRKIAGLVRDMMSTARKPSFNPMDLLFMNSAKYGSWSQKIFPHWGMGAQALRR